MPSILTITFLAIVAVTVSANIDDACDSDDDCSVTNSECIFRYDTCDRGACGCKFGFYSITATECREIRQIGESCADNSDCIASTQGSECDSDDECACVETTSGATMKVASEGPWKYCYEFKAGEECVNHNQCLTTIINPAGGQCDSTDSECACTAAYTLQGQVCTTVGNGDSCAPAAGETVDKACDVGLVCSSDEVCECPANQKYNNALNMCIHDDVTLVGVGQGCDLTPLQADTEYCNSDNLACDRCPGETGAKQCQELNGAALTAVSVTSLLGAFLLSIVLA